MIFGNKKTFAIECHMLYGDEFPEDWGSIYFWVNGKNLFAFKDNKPSDTYHWYIYMFSRWLCEGLPKIMAEDDFPIHINANNAFEFVDEVDNFLNRLNKDTEEYKILSNASFDWTNNHCFFISRGGSFAPIMYVRASKKKIEIAWENKDIYPEEEVEFLNLEGVEYVSREDFFNASVEFLKYYCSLPEKQKLDSSIELMQVLQKTIEKVEV